MADGMDLQSATREELQAEVLRLRELVGGTVQEAVKRAVNDERARIEQSYWLEVAELKNSIESLVPTWKTFVGTTHRVCDLMNEDQQRSAPWTGFRVMLKSTGDKVLAVGEALSALTRKSAENGPTPKIVN